MKKLDYLLSGLFVGLIITIAGACSIAFAQPTSSPPSSSNPEILNSGAISQSKNGALTINNDVSISSNLRALGDIIAGSFCIDGDCNSTWPSPVSIWEQNGDDIYALGRDVAIGTITASGDRLYVEGDTTVSGSLITDEICDSNDCYDEWMQANYTFIAGFGGVGNIVDITEAMNIACADANGCHMRLSMRYVHNGSQYESAHRMMDMAGNQYGSTTRWRNHIPGCCEYSWIDGNGGVDTYFDVWSCDITDRDPSLPASSNFDNGLGVSLISQSYNGFSTTCTLSIYD